jgi:diguanylate cyclase (GGDEF)-like protein
MRTEESGTILVVDDNVENIKLAVNYLKEEGFRVAFATSSTKSLVLVQEHRYDLILMDVMMPEIDGFETCRRIKALPAYRDTPIIFLTARTDKESVVQGFESGGSDYVAKPFHGAELILRVKTHLELKRTREQLEDINAELQREVLAGLQLSEELERSHQELQRANQQLHAMASTDPLTGLMNRRRMLDFLDYEASRSRRQGGCYSVIMCDIDHFKKVNDTYGHDSGDNVLKAIAGVFQGGIREQDKASRWGGEEFLFLFPETTGEGAVTIAEKLRIQIEEMSIQVEDDIIGVTLTFGIATSEISCDFDEIIRKADLALYQGKEQGRNRTVLYSPSASSEENGSDSIS